MPDLTLAPRSALGGTEPRIDQIGGITLTERPDIALASLAARRGKAPALDKAIAPLLGAALPDISASSGAGDIRAFWTGPDQWILRAPYGSHEDLAAQVKSAVGNAGSVTEQSDAWAGFSLMGDDLTGVLELLARVDPASLRDGTALRSQIHHIGCFLICESALSELLIFGPRSSAASLHHALISAIRSAESLRPAPSQS
ncbi:MAG: sarcosine oxidase subunit gamma [Mangrovicoccus sp.]|nr:sarcosine oxidase subunit gamma [Mangrovicoccus sp.]